MSMRDTRDGSIHPRHVGPRRRLSRRRVEDPRRARRATCRGRAEEPRGDRPPPAAVPVIRCGQYADRRGNPDTTAMMGLLGIILLVLLAIIVAWLRNRSL